MATEPTSKPLKPPALPDTCNVIDCSTGRQQFWRFAKGKRRMKLVDVRDTLMDQPVPAKHLANAYDYFKQYGFRDERCNTATL